MTNNTEYSFNSHTGPFLVEFDKLLITERNTTMIWYKIIGSTMRLLFTAGTYDAGTEQEMDYAWLSLYTQEGERIDNPKCIRTPSILRTRSAKEILAANGFTLIHSKPRIQDLV